MPDTGRRVVLDGAVNFRDLGGLPTRHGGLTRRTVLFRSDSLHALSERDLAHLHDEIGLRTVVDLRMDDECAALAPPPGAFRDDVTVLRLPMFDALRDEWRDPMSWATEEQRAERYYEFAVAGAPSVAALARVLGEPGRTPAVVHCHSGRDRTGVAVGLLLDVLGVEREAIAADYAVTARYITEHELSPRRMLLLLELVDARHGSAEALLRRAGLTDADAAALRTAFRPVQGEH